MTFCVQFTVITLVIKSLDKCCHYTKIMTFVCYLSKISGFKFRILTIDVVIKRDQCCVYCYNQTWHRSLFMMMRQSDPSVALTVGDVSEIMSYFPSGVCIPSAEVLHS